ncbi:MAG: CDGSH iron-sulfur domain-containing protein [Actinomycetota bacterium]|nr:CDGSH iron-sulfur domain-containing protein [Actinomycetota bacterium]
MKDTEGMRISITRNGPYVVSGSVPLVRLEILTNEAGESVGWREVERFPAAERYLLCRCGSSDRKPFCDGSHMSVSFDGSETAGHDPYAMQAVPLEGPGVKLHDARKLCAEARFCDRGGGLWNLIEECDDSRSRALAEEEATLCPSGRYVLCDEDGTEIEPELPARIALVEDPSVGASGPLFVSGGIPVTGADGEEYEVRNRVTLCRCGRSTNKPFCDGSHLGATPSDR